MKLSGEELHYKLVNEYKIIGEKGIINFSGNVVKNSWCFSQK